jgi:ATP-dependent Clp protease ATP-binding subunit ClpA
MSFKTKLLKEKIRQAPRKFKNSKFFLALVMLAIGVSYTVVYYEGMALKNEYTESLRYIEDRYPNTREITLVNEAHADTEIPKEKPVEVASPDSEVEKIADTIFTLESSKGVNDGCVRKGLGFNGYGFRQNSREWKCFESRDEVRDLVNDWIKDKQKKGMATDEMLCWYNTGLHTSSCWYSDQAKLLQK